MARTCTGGGVSPRVSAVAVDAASAGGVLGSPCGRRSSLPVANRPPALTRNRRPRREQVLDRAQLLRGADDDEHVAVLESRIRRGRRIVATVPAAEADDQGAGLGAHAQVADRPADLPAGGADLDLLEAEVGPAVRGEELEEDGHLRFEDELCHLLSGGVVWLDDPVGAGTEELLSRILGRSAGDDQKVRPERTRRERDVEVVHV